MILLASGRRCQLIHGQLLVARQDAVEHGATELLAFVTPPLGQVKGTTEEELSDQLPERLAYLAPICMLIKAENEFSGLVHGTLLLLLLLRQQLEDVLKLLVLLVIYMMVVEPHTWMICMKLRQVLHVRIDLSKVAHKVFS